MIRVLQVISSLQTGGGVQTMLKNYYTYMDSLAFSTDFVVCGKDIGGMESWFKTRGAHIYHIPPRTQQPIENICSLRRIIKEGHYDVLHCHQDYHGAIAVAMAKSCNIPVRIIHSHQAYPQEDAVKKMRRYAGSYRVMRDATVLAACGERAGAWLYGQNAIESKQVVILRNAIDVASFAFSYAARHRLRQELGIYEETTVIGHVGRFTEQKNHALVLSIFAEFHRRRPDSVLILAGDGPLRLAIERQAVQLNIQQAVRFLGMRLDIPQLMSAMDVFLLPSRWEGLGIVAVEAQANGLPCICSHKVPQEVKLTEQLHFMPAEFYMNPMAWCDVIERAVFNGRQDGYNAVCNAGYDIHREAKKLESLYFGGTLLSQEF